MTSRARPSRWRSCAPTVERFGALDFAHNNAGVELQALLTETAEPDWDLVMDVNVKGVWLGLKAQIPQMIAQGGGAIVNTSSLAGLIGAPALGAYVASKHAVVGLTKTAAIECVPTTSASTPSARRRSRRR